MIKNHKGEICDYRPYIDVDINGEIESISKLIEECKQRTQKVNEKDIKLNIPIIMPISKEFIGYLNT